MIVCVIGCHASGKKTQADLLLEAKVVMGFSSAGEYFRWLVKGGTKLEGVSTGGLADDRRANELFAAFIDESVEEVYANMMDGYPRSVDQLLFMLSLLRRADLLDQLVVIYLCLPLEEAERRLRASGPRSGRDDDSPEAIANRRTICSTQIYPVMRLLRRALKKQGKGQFIQVHAKGTPHEIHERIKEELLRIRHRVYA